MSAEDELLVVRQLAGLRAAGESQLDAVTAVAGVVPPGPLRSRLEEARRVLASGAAGGELLSSTGATAKSLSVLAESLEAKLEAREVARELVTTLRLVLVVPLVALAVIGWSPLERIFENSFVAGYMPAPTRFFFNLASRAQFAGLAVAAVLYFLLGRISTSRMPGASSLDEAARAWELSVDGGRDWSGLRLPARNLVAQLATLVPVPRALELTAEELRRQGRNTVALGRALAPVLAFFFYTNIFGFGVASLALPIFVIAGAIR